MTLSTASIPSTGTSWSRMCALLRNYPYVPRGIWPWVYARWARCRPGADWRWAAARQAESRARPNHGATPVGEWSGTARCCALTIWRLTPQRGRAPTPPIPMGREGSPAHRSGLRNTHSIRTLDVGCLPITLGVSLPYVRMRDSHVIGFRRVIIRSCTCWRPG